MPPPDVVEALRALDSGMHAVREELRQERAAAAEAAESATAAAAAAGAEEPAPAPAALAAAPAPGAEFVSVLEGFLGEATARQEAMAAASAATDAAVRGLLAWLGEPPDLPDPSPVFDAVLRFSADLDAAFRRVHRMVAAAEAAAGRPDPRPGKPLPRRA